MPGQGVGEVHHTPLPNGVDLLDAVGGTPGGEVTTLVMHNFPESYTRDVVLGMLYEHGFRGLVNFIYLPSNFTTGRCFGYAFVNFVTPHAARSAAELFDGFCAWRVDADTTCHVAAAEINGLEANIERFRNSRVMHRSVPDYLRPLLLDASGEPVEFPAPTRSVRPPHRLRSGV